MDKCLWLLKYIFSYSEKYGFYLRLEKNRKEVVDLVGNNRAVYQGAENPDILASP